MPTNRVFSDYALWVNSLPLAVAFGVTYVEAALGVTRMTLNESPIATNPYGAVHGGIVSAVNDHAMGRPR